MPTPTMAQPTQSIWWQAGLLVFVSVVAVYIGLRYEQASDGVFEETRFLPSIFNRKQSGLSGLYEIASQAKLNCDSWQSPYRELQEAKGMLVMIGPTELTSEAEFAQILKWVNAGNQLVYFDSFGLESPKNLLRSLHLKAKRSHTITDQIVKTKASLPELAHVDHLRLSTKIRLTGGQPIVEDDSGTLIAAVTYGKGRVLVGTAPSLCANGGLADEHNWSNFQFLVNWLCSADNIVYFDERCHGFSGSPNVFVYVMRGWLGPVTLQLLVILLIAVLGAHQRFGDVKKIKVHREISNLEFINGMANTYERAQANFAALETIANDFRNRICRLLNISPHSADAEIIASLQSADPEIGSNLNQFLADYKRLMDAENISAAELSTYVKNCDLLADQMQIGLASKSRL